MIMDVDCVILGRLWLYDKNATIYDQSNICRFEQKRKKIKLMSRELKTEQSKLKPVTTKKTNNISLIAPKNSVKIRRKELPS